MADRAFPIISVSDLPATQRFYERLGFRKTFQFPPDGEPGFVTMERDGSSIGIGAGGGPDEAAFRYWVYVDDVEETFEQLCASGAPVVSPPADQEWGERFAAVRDPAGNLVYVASESA
ncbi:MAG: hypothetical protein AVDCRST_MAG50-2828 [uncultured Acidimicrobiales bacterium]|uniref:VOC domain-containing protein n=1 Tax=uncultured Acidimicrobiales bacterium TaxID=310071 RepID=A0A6J4IVU8_9ACTN|nr:MAG: hypothetical protein AVDCRST_MAG50-2828 [uncultured Acidimicrobiales bacterium]